MIFIKLYFHIMAFIKKCFYKVIYGRKIKFGKGVSFRKGFSLVIEKGATVEIGDGTFFNNYCSINALEKVVIGKNCLFGENVKIYDHNHCFNKKDILIKNQGYKKQEINIGSNCWVGSNVIILKGITIGNNSVIGAGEIIKHSINDDTVFSGNTYSAINFKEDNDG